MGLVSAYRFCAKPKPRAAGDGVVRLDVQGPVVDIGAGRGYFLALRARGVECLGVEISEEAAAKNTRTARQRDRPRHVTFLDFPRRAVRVSGIFLS